MDQAHNSITADETDFSSMADWDFYKYVDDTRFGMAVARVIRLFTGNGFRKMNLLGFSGGAVLGLRRGQRGSRAASLPAPRGGLHPGGSGQ